MALRLLGTHGVDSYEKFLKALNENSFYDVVAELRRTEKNIKFGQSEIIVHPLIAIYLFIYLLCKKSHWLFPPVLYERR